MDKKKILDNALNNLRKDVEKTFTNEDNLKKTFLNRLENTLPEPTVFELIKKKWKAFSASLYRIYRCPVNDTFAICNQRNRERQLTH